MDLLISQLKYYKREIDVKHREKEQLILELSRKKEEEERRREKIEEEEEILRS